MNITANGKRTNRSQTESPIFIPKIQNKAINNLQPLKMGTPPPFENEKAHQIESLGNPDLFRKVWKQSIEDNNLSLYGFRRFKTTHLVNDRLGLRHSKRDLDTPVPEQVVTPELIRSLRNLIKQYGKLYAQLSTYHI